MLDQLLGCSSSAAAVKAEMQRPPWPMNPFPPGVRSGSATDKVQFILESHPRRWFEHCELMRLTGHSRGAISWALRYLVERSMARSITSARHPSYLRYMSSRAE